MDWCAATARNTEATARGTMTLKDLDTSFDESARELLTLMAAGEIEEDPYSKAFNEKFYASFDESARTRYSPPKRAHFSSGSSSARAAATLLRCRRQSSNSAKS